MIGCSLEIYSKSVIARFNRSTAFGNGNGNDQCGILGRFLPSSVCSLKLFYPL